MIYEEMKPREIDELLATKPLAYLVWGSHEWHGVQNPVGLDTLKAYNMTLELCAVTGGVVLPPVYCGYHTLKPFKGFKKTFEFSRELVMRYVIEHLENLRDEGYKLVVLIMGHYGIPHVEAIQEAVALFAERHPLPKVFAMRECEPASWIGVSGGDHAGMNETSLMMHYRPDLVDMSRLPAEVVFDRDGATPNAPQATREHGAMLARLFVEQAAPKVRELLEEAMQMTDDGAIQKNQHSLERDKQVFTDIIAGAQKRLAAIEEQLSQK